jgi:exonuclease SbcD
MKLLHTSDWHIGRNFNGFDLHDPQLVFIDHIINVVKENKVDVLLISGDVYDRPTPSLASIDLLSYALRELSKLTKVVITSGNHDSARRLGFGKELFEASNIFIRTTVDDITRPILLPFENSQVAIYGIPYLDPYTTSSLLVDGVDPSKMATHNHQFVLEAAMSRIAEHKKTVKADKTVLMSHAWYAGGDVSESETNIGGLGQASLELLKGFDYSALGHLHKPKVIEEHIRYSGSALPYSFSERSVEKCTYLVELTKGKIKVVEIKSPVYKTMHEISDSMENLLTSAKYKDLKDQFVKIRITDERPPVNPKIALSERYQFIVELVSESVVLQIKNYEEMKNMSPAEIIKEFLTEIRHFEADPWEEKQITSALDQIQAGVKLGGESDEECDHSEIDPKDSDTEVSS